MKPDLVEKQFQLTTGQRGDDQDGIDTSGTLAAYEHNGHSANKAFGIAIEHSTAVAPSTRARSWNSDAATVTATTDAAQDTPDFSRVVGVPPRWLRRAPGTTLHPLQEWEGYVIEINESEFTARLIDLTAGDSIEKEEAEIPLTEISDSDAAKMKIGSIFRWVIGYERSPTGTKRRVSHIVFRDLPAMTRADQQAGKAWAAKIMAAFKQ